MLEVLRYTVFGAVVLSSLAAVGSWAVRTRRISPFSKSAHLIRRTTDPILKPFEGWLLQRGANPQNAEWWMLGAAVVGGIVVISLAGWIAAELGRVAFAARGGPFSSVRLLIYYTGQLISLAIFIRVIGSWFGVGPHSAWMRPMYVLTDWIIVPLRRVIPPIGMIDITPIVAWFGVRILTSILTGF